MQGKALLSWQGIYFVIVLHTYSIRILTEHSGISYETSWRNCWDAASGMNFPLSLCKKYSKMQSWHFASMGLPITNYTWMEFIVALMTPHIISIDMKNRTYKYIVMYSFNTCECIFYLTYQQKVSGIFVTWLHISNGHYQRELLGEDNSLFSECTHGYVDDTLWLSTAIGEHDWARFCRPCQSKKNHQ